VNRLAGDGNRQWDDPALAPQEAARRPLISFDFPYSGDFWLILFSNVFQRNAANSCFLFSSVLSANYTPRAILYFAASFAKHKSCDGPSKGGDETEKTPNTLCYRSIHLIAALALPPRVADPSPRLHRPMRPSAPTCGSLSNQGSGMVW
jgi:hypothetical protein